RRVCAPAGCKRPPRPRRDAERGGVLPRARRRLAVAPGRARALGKLAVSPRRGDWDAFVARFARLGIGADYTRFWWDIRPHPKVGTLEVRMPDQPTALTVTAG